MLNLNAAHTRALQMDNLLSLDEIRYQSRNATLISALYEYDQRNAPDYTATASDYRVFKTWDAPYPEGCTLFRNNLKDYPTSGGAARIIDEAIRDNLRHDDRKFREQLQYTPTGTPTTQELTPENIVAGPLSEDKARDGRRKLRELIEAKNAAELALKTQALELETWKNQAEYSQSADVALLDATDTRTWHLFAEAARIAEREEYCSEYDRIAELGGVPTRAQLRDHGLLAIAGRITVNISFSVYVDVDDIENYDIEQSTVDELATEYIQSTLNSSDWDTEVSE